jgi:hypothetical protein
MKFDLPMINPKADPAFTDAKTCAAWLLALPLANVGPAHGRLLGELEELNCFEMLAGERVKVLELLGEAVLFVQSELARKYTGKAVPLGNQERAVFLNVLALWSAFSRGWQQCFQDLVKGIGGVSAQAALICQRTVWSAGLKFTEHYTVYQDFGAGEWLQVNQVYAFAERSGVAEKRVSHPSQKSAPDVSCAEAFAQVHMMALANPNEHAPRQHALIARWTELWASKFAPSEKAPGDAAKAPLSVDLDADACASRAPKEDGANLRYFQAHEIEKSLATRISALKRGESPDSLGLGSDVSEGLAAQILVMLKQQWCEDRTARKIQRRSASQHAQVCCGIAAMHYFISGRPFETPANVSALTPQQREHIETFGQLSTRANENQSMTQGFVLEQWRILDESLSGFRLERPRNVGSVRFLHQQLAAVRPSDADYFSLCSVRWISVFDNSILCIGARLMPGVPQGIAIRIGGIKSPADKFVPALSLPAVLALRAPATLIVPAGWFRPKRLIDIRGGSIEKVLLTAAIERGSDFERCTYEPA